MAVMGDASADVWAKELRWTGRVVFPQRPRAMVFKVAIAVLPCVMIASDFSDMLKGGGFGRILAFLILASSIACFGYIASQRITGRPVMVVDRQGIHHGRKVMLWTDVGSIGIPHGPGFIQTLPIIPADVWAKDLTLSQENVRDVLAFAHWLEEVLKDQRRLASTLRLPPARDD
jgi:hypothetical protein